MEPTVFYLSATSNDQWNVAYIAHFETPTSQWIMDEDIAQIIVEGLVFDPRER